MTDLNALRQAVAVLQEARKDAPSGFCEMCSLAEVIGKGPYCVDHYCAALALDDAEDAVILAAIQLFASGDQI